MRFGGALADRKLIRDRHHYAPVGIIVSWMQIHLHRAASALCIRMEEGETWTIPAEFAVIWAGVICIHFLSLSFFVCIFGYEEKELDPEGIFLSVKSSVYERAKHMLIVHIFRAGEIGQRARYPENLIIGAS